MASRKVFLFTTDISKYVQDVENIVQASGEYGQLTINDIPGLTGNSINGFWDVNNPSSPFYGVSDLSPYTITIQLDGVNVFIGGILTLDTDNRSCTTAVGLRSSLQVALERGLVYSSEQMETPSQAIANICLEYGLPFDSASFAVANNIYITDEIYIEVRAVDPFVKMIDIFQNILDIGVAKMYSLNGVLYYNVYDDQSTPVASIKTFSDRVTGKCEIYDYPVSEWVQKDSVNGYSIETMGGIADFGAPEQQSRTISAAGDAPVRILALQSGIWIGDRWMRYLNRPQRRITFGVPAGFAKVIPIQAAVTLDYSRKGWQPTILDLVSIENTNRVMGMMTGLTR